MPMKLAPLNLKLSVLNELPENVNPWLQNQRIYLLGRDLQYHPSITFNLCWAFCSWLHTNDLCLFYHRLSHLSFLSLLKEITVRHQESKLWRKVNSKTELAHERSQMNVRASTEGWDWVSNVFREKQDFALPGHSCESITRCRYSAEHEGFRDGLLRSSYLA